MTDTGPENRSLVRTRIHTDRLRLKPVLLHYADDIYRHFTPRITRYMFPAPAESIADTRNFILNSLQRLGSGDDLTLVITRRETGEFLGVCGLHRLRKFGDPELGIWIKEPAHGNGFGKEAIVALKAWADDVLRCAGLIYPVDRRNTASRKIPEGLGGIVVQQFTKTSMSGNALDLLVYRIADEAG